MSLINETHKYRRYPPTQAKIALAKAIVTAFPCLEDVGGGYVSVNS